MFSILRGKVSQANNINVQPAGDKKALQSRAENSVLFIRYNIIEINFNRRKFIS